ncbi:acyl-CoA N-acyltransferase [Macrophomina phaseolina]|uniref:Acyl-CoA N-acyltransferase n=1 Tax=Macrophomina phaseolina TaxID=35725 RepID=A0ABQ8GFA3_9PEZI|nr:acyl-CoA N-acyltransferase [Macrophomina phaseolina]
MHHSQKPKYSQGKTSSMTYTIYPVKPTDADGLAEAMMRSFYLDPHWASLWRGISLDKIIRDCAKRLPWNLVKASMGKRHQKVVDDESQKIVGYARWILPEEQDDEWADALVKELDPERRRMYEQQFQDVTEEGKIRGLNSDMVEELSEAIEQAESQVRSTCGRLLTLDYLATHPEHQKRGIGSMLLSSGLAYADRKGLETIIVAKTAGVRLYKEHGFRIIEKIQQERPQCGWSEAYTTTILLRQPQASPTMP